MIGKISSGSSFGGLIRYITDPDKQQWTDSRNLMGTRQSDVIQEIEMVASRSRATSPVYHISVSWNPSDKPSKFDMLEVADRVLNELNLERNQALIVSHKDTGNPHIHMAINRVDPETFKAVDRWNDMHKVEGVLRQIEKEKGWQETPGLLYGDPGNVKGKGEKLWETKHRVKVNEALKGAGIGAPDYRPVRVRALEVKKALYLANDWKTFDDTLASRGLWVESKGAGMVVTDGAMSVKASSVGRDFSRGKLEKKFGERLSTYEDRRELNVDVNRGISSVNNWTNAVERIKLEATEKDLERSEHLIDTELRRIDNFDTHLANLKKRIQEGFEKTFHNPDEAQRELARFIERKGLTDAGAELVSAPRLFGDVKVEGWMLQQLGNAISEMDQKYKEWERYLEAKILDSPQERNKKRRELQEKHSDLSRIKIPAIKQELRKNMRESEAGYTVSRGAEEVIAVSRAISAIMKNYQPLAKKVAGRSVASFKKDLVKQSEAGKALVQITDQSMKATRLILKIGNALKSGGASLAQSAICHAMHQHRYAAIQKQLEREREAQRGDFSR